MLFLQHFALLQTQNQAGILLLYLKKLQCFALFF